LITPKISNTLKGTLGELYYKAFCEQQGWAFTRLENIHASMNPDWIFTFKKGFHRIKIRIPKQFRNEIDWLAQPTNRTEHSPSFVFDFLACKVGKFRNYTGVKTGDFFSWVESKTGTGGFSTNQVNAMEKIKIPLAIFHIENVLAPPGDIKMGFDIKAGKKWLDIIVPVDNEHYELEQKLT